MIIVFAAALAVSGCALDLYQDVYSRDEVGSKVEIQEARVISVRNVQIEGTRSGVSAVAGAAAGGIGGSYAGGGRGGAINAIAGAMTGRLLGAAMEGAIKGSEGVEYLVDLDNGETVPVVQPKGDDSLQPGDSALFFLGHHIRVLPAEAEGNVRRKDVREDAPEPSKSWSRTEVEA
jgi:outer membrane lipoprotein SlyB